VNGCVDEDDGCGQVTDQEYYDHSDEHDGDPLFLSYRLKRRKNIRMQVA